MFCAEVAAEAWLSKTATSMQTIGASFQRSGHTVSIAAHNSRVAYTSSRVRFTTLSYMIFLKMLVILGMPSYGLWRSVHWVERWLLPHPTSETLRLHWQKINQLSSEILCEFVQLPFANKTLNISAAPTQQRGCVIIRRPSVA
jgi:hypothetical protein